MKTGQYGWGWHSENKSTFTDKPILLDLGLVKLNLSKNMYSSRLVFENAMIYNPKTDEVHGMANQLMFYFEMLFRPIQAKLPTNQRMPERYKKPKFSDPVAPVLNKKNHSTASNSIKPPVVQPPMRMQ
ncbi:putative chromatin remodeler Bromodomain family [Helianthus anomalus]